MDETLKDLERRGKLVDLLSAEEKTRIYSLWKKDLMQVELERKKAQVVKLQAEIAQLTKE